VSYDPPRGSNRNAIASLTVDTLPDMTSRDPYIFACPCCKLPQPAAIDKATTVTAPVCADCTHHQGDQDRKRLQRAEAHERMLWERMIACRASEAQARSATSAAQASAATAHDAMVAALRSRGRLAERIVEAADESPSAFMALARDPDVVKWARRAQMHEADEDPDLWPDPSPARPPGRGS
jgi:hypothetical protein